MYSYSVLPLDVMALELLQVEDRSSYELQSLKLIEGVGQGSGKFEVIGEGGFGSIYKGIVLRHKEHIDMSANANEFKGVKKLEISHGNMIARTIEFKGVKRLGRFHGVLLEKSTGFGITEPANHVEEIMVAVKQIALSGVVTREDLDREARTMRVFWGCRNFAAVYGLTYCKQLESVCIVMEVVSPGRNLKQFLRSRDTAAVFRDDTGCAESRDVLWWIQKVSLFREIVLALMLCHGKGVYHGDLKGENILLDERLIPKLIDFGLSFQMRDVKYLRSGKLGGSLFWMAPEVTDATPEVKEDPFPSDVYSLGMLLFEVLLDGEVPDSFSDEIYVILIDKFDGRYPVSLGAVAPSSDSFVSERVIKPLKVLVNKCCDGDRKKRNSLQECLREVEDVHSDLLRYAGHREDLHINKEMMRTFRNRFPEVREYLVLSPSLNMVMSEDGTLLVHRFCRLDFVEGVQYIVERSASWGFQAERDIPYMSLLCVDSESLSTLRYIASTWRDLLRRQHLLIHRACSSSNLDMFQLLLNIGVDVDTWVAEEPFMKPIHQLAAKGKTEFLRCLLDQVDDASYINTATPLYGRCYDGDNGEKIRSFSRDVDGLKLQSITHQMFQDVPRHVPLYYAVVEDRVETVKFILQRGGVYFEKSVLEVTRVSDDRGYWFSSLLHLAWESFAIGVALELHASISHPFPDILRQHVEEVALSYPNRKPMHVACQKGREKAFEAAFNREDYNESFYVIRALMFYIARGGSKEMIDIILAKQTFVDQYFVSETYSIQDVAILLLAEGTSTNLLDSPHSVGRISVLDVAAVSRNTEVVQHILKVQPEDSASEGTITDDESIEAAIPEFRDNPYELALDCCRKGDVEVLKSYERSGLDLDAVRDDETRHSILHSAVDEAHINMVKYLLQRGFPVDSTNWSLGETPLQHACSRRPDATSAERERKLDVASLLIEKGADPNFVNHDGYTAMDQPLDFHDKEVVRFLIDHGFDLGRKDRYGEDYMTRVSNI